MQLLAKFKKILYLGFRATLNFRKFLSMNYTFMVTYCYSLLVVGKNVFHLKLVSTGCKLVSRLDKSALVIYWL